MSFFLKVPGPIIRQKFYSDKYRASILEQTSLLYGNSVAIPQEFLTNTFLGLPYIGTSPLTSSRHGGWPQLCELLIYLYVSN